MVGHFAGEAPDKTASENQELEPSYAAGRRNIGFYHRRKNFTVDLYEVLGYVNNVWNADLVLIRRDIVSFNFDGGLCLAQQQYGAAVIQ